MRLRYVFSAALALGAASAASTFAEVTVDKSAQTPAAITVTSPTIKANETIPVDHTADGKNESPALAWSGAPANTKQFALVYDDPDVVFGGQTFVHWLVYKIPGT
ncbi:MAG TPA: YbhB/YbcL family Raf kinase inhibitor-like protein, partial [Vicinamibacterales bacterium]|nr:YbhB/YbcL family Raf kinase inhibitor-like protein [Vicinamibacterales bacterium]